MKYLKNNKGDIVQFIIVIIVSVSIAINLMPKFNKACETRQNKAITIYNSDDTVTN